MDLNEYLKVHAEFSKIEQEILADIPNSSFPKSLQCLYYKIKSIEQLKDGIFSANNLYSTLVLYRSLIEHSLVSFYVFRRLKIENSDKAGEDYYDGYANSEFFKQANYSTRLDYIKNNLTHTNTIEGLAEKYPDLSSLSQADMEEYNRIGNQFADIKKIGYFLIKHKDNEPAIRSLSEQVFDLLEKYNFLSSYVHGGPYAERETFYPEEKSNQLKDKQIIEGWALTLSRLIETILVLLLRYDFHDKYADSFRIMYKYRGE